MDDPSVPQPNRFKELAELIGIFGKWGVLFIGGLCLLVYANEIGSFPEGLQLGEGLAFYMVAAGFVLVYGFYTLGLVALGSIAARWPYQGFVSALYWYRGKRIKKKKQSSFEHLVPIDFSVMWGAEIWGGALLGIAFIGFLVIQGAALWLQIELALMEGALLGMLVVSRRRRRFLDSNLAPIEPVSDNGQDRKQQHTIIQRMLLGMMVIAPLILGSSQSALVNSAFRVAQLRKDNATIQIQKQWATRLVDRGQTASPSFLGDDYREFVGINVLLRSVGTKVTIELPAHGEKKASSLAVPAEHIVVE